MKRIVSLLLLATALLTSLSLSACTSPREKFSEYSFDYFDTVTTVTGYAQSKAEFDEISAEIMSELESYHKLFDIYNTYDGINNLATINSLNDGVHTAVKVDERIIDMLLFSKEMHSRTGGLVNVAMGSVLSIWHRHRQNGINDPSSATLPPSEQLTQAAIHTDIDKMILDEQASTVFLSDPQMLLDVGAIAKGYAVEMVAQMLISKGITGYVINVGGNVRTVGTRENHEPWVAGIENPNGSDGAPYYATVELTDLSLVTSGSYQRYYIVDGKNYNHIIDPATLFPADRHVSVSVICESSALADALSTALFCMSVEDGKALIEGMSGVEAMWADKDGRLTYSSGFADLIKN